MNIFEILGGLLGQTKKIELKKLPSQGLFYPKGFEVKISKAKIEDIEYYENNFNSDKLLIVIELIKRVVKNSTKFGKYKFEDLRSVDIIYIFLEIVKFTNRKPIYIKSGNTLVEFGHENFSYFDFSQYQFKNQEILIDGYRFSMPTIGVEDCLTRFLIEKYNQADADVWNDYNYDFIFFLGNKNYLDNSEIENLVIIFNFDLEPAESKKVKAIIAKFMNMVGYSLVDRQSGLVDVKTKLDLEKIWK